MPADVLLYVIMKGSFLVFLLLLLLALCINSFWESALANSVSISVDLYPRSMRLCFRVLRLFISLLSSVVIQCMSISLSSFQGSQCKFIASVSSGCCLSALSNIHLCLQFFLSS